MQIRVALLAELCERDPSVMFALAVFFAIMALTNELPEESLELFP